MNKDKLATLEDVVRAAFARGALHGLRTAAAELFDLALVRFRRDPLPRVYADRPPRKGNAVRPTLHDVKQALRRAVSHPAYSATVIGVLALGIAVNTVVFSVADATLFRGLPYPNGPRLMEMFNRDPQGKFSFPGLLPDSYVEWRRHTEVFQALEGWNYAAFVMLGGGEPERVAGAYVTPGLFPAAGVRPLLGRGFENGDGEPGRDAIVLISYGLWQQRLAARPDAIGQKLTLNDRAYTIVGVMPPRFRFPASQQKVWLPTPQRQTANGRLQAIALLQPGLTPDAAQARLNTISESLAHERPRPAGWKVRLMPLRGTVLNAWTERGLEILTVAVLVVLLIACANLANLGFAQTLARQRELSIRAALGASRWRLVRALLVEHFVLGTAGGAAGLALAHWGIRLALAVAPAEITVWTANEIRIDTRILAFTAIATFASTLMFGLLPAWRASRADAGDALKSRTATAGAPHGRIRTTLVVVEVALSVVLLTGAALLIRSFARLTSLDPGFDPDGLVSVSMEIPADRYPAGARRTFFEQVSRAVRGIPGVTAVSIANGLPTDGGNIHFGNLEVEGGARDPHETVLPDAVVDSAFFSTLGIPIVAGRGIGDGDPATNAVVSESLARRLAGNGSAVGLRFRLFALEDWYTVVGVAREVHESRAIERSTEYEMYTPLWRPAPPRTNIASVSSAGGARSFVSLRMIVRANRSADLVAPIKAAVWTVDPSQPVGEVIPVRDLMATSLAEDRFAALLLGTFAALALVIAAAGLYAVLAHLVAQRRQEIGIRMALGAAARDVTRMIVGRGVAMTAAGLVIGLAAAWAAARFLANQLYEVQPHDPFSFAAVPAVLFGIALLASWLPARRALSVDPASALRAE